MARPPRKVIIIGSGGRLGAALMREFDGKFDLAGFNHAQLDLTRPEQIDQALGDLDFDVAVNCAAMTNVDLCESKRDEAFAINGEAPRRLAKICAGKKARLIHISTDYVFDGEKREPYVEEDAATPVSVYGESKLAGEKAVLTTDRRHLVLRVSWVFGPDRPSFVDAIIKGARERETVEAVADKYSSPTYTRDLAEALPLLFDKDFPGGTFHFANTGEASWQSYGQQALDFCRELGIALKTSVVRPSRLADIAQFVAPRPVYTVLSSTKFAALTGSAPRAWRDALLDYIRSHYVT